jgi:PKD repeat protein
VKEKKILRITLIALLLCSGTMVGMNTSFAGASSSETTISVEPPVTNATALETFDVQITVTNVTNLYGWDVKLSFNSEVIEAVTVTMPTPNFLTQSGWYTTWEIGVQNPKIDNFTGTVRMGDTYYLRPYPPPPYPPEGAAGDGTLAIITFVVKAESGISPLALESTKLFSRNPDGDKVDIHHETIDGVFDNRPTVLPPVADFTVNPIVGIDGLPMTFDGSPSYDPDGGWIVNWFWDFGDDTNATGETVDHIYTLEGVYAVKLNVTDIDGLTDELAVDVTVLDWMEEGAFVDLVGKCAWPQKRQLKEYWGDRTNILYAKIGNPTDAPMQAYVEFTLYSRDELRYLGKLTTETVTVDPHKKEVLTVLFDTYGNPQWSCVSGGDWWPYGYIVWLRKYLVFAECYSFRDDDWKPGNVKKDFQFKVSPASHDIAILSATANATEVSPGDLVAIDVVVENQGDLDELFDVTVRMKDDVLDIQSVTLLAGANTTVTLIFDTTGITAPKTCVLWVELPKPAVIYEKDYSDQYALVVVDVI